MKKFILVIVCALLMIMLIAFNYLLWDRENKKKDILNLEQSKVSNSASINALGRNIKELEDENRALKDTIELMEGNIKELDENIAALENERNALIQILEQKNVVINKFRYEVDPAILEAPVRRWVEAINSRDYESAYNLQTDAMNENLGILNIAHFKNIFNNSIEGIELKSIKLDVEGIPADTPGGICFLVTLDVKKAVNVNDEKIRFGEGKNERLLTIDYNKEKNIWMVSGIYTVQ
jgi:cell division protein FtsB